MVDWIELINDEKGIDDIIWGQDIRKQGHETRKTVKTMVSQKASDQFVQKMMKRMGSLGSSKGELLQEVDPNWQRVRGERLKGTEAEAQLTNDEFLMLASNGKWRPGMPVPAELK